MSFDRFFRFWSCASAQYPPVGRVSIWTLYFIVWIDFFRISFIGPFLAPMVAGFGGSQETMTKRVVVTNYIFVGVGSLALPLLGLLSDRYGRRLAMLWSLITAAV